jgi:hypothetical protein
MVTEIGQPKEQTEIDEKADPTHAEVSGNFRLKNFRENRHFDRNFFQKGNPLGLNTFTRPDSSNAIYQPP